MKCRLHALADGAGLYAPYFRGLQWQEILYLNDEKLKQLGITNTNAQQLLLRAFMTERTPQVIMIYFDFDNIK